MGDVDVKTRREAENESAAISRAAEPMPACIAPRRRLRMFPLLITLAPAHQWQCGLANQHSVPRCRPLTRLPVVASHLSSTRHAIPRSGIPAREIV